MLRIFGIYWIHSYENNSHNYPDAFIDKDNFKTDKNEMVDTFNEYFVNVGIALANNVAPANQHVSVHDCWSPRTKAVHL